MSQFYFAPFEHRTPPAPVSMGPVRRFLWQMLAVAALVLGALYLVWRWGFALNTEAMVFSVAVAAAETGMWVGLALFIHNLWDEADTPVSPPPASRAEAGLAGDGPIGVDILIATCDEDPELVALSVDAALAVRVPPGVQVEVVVLDDGARPEMAQMARARGVRWLTRQGREGYKAGNLKNGLAHTKGDFVVICDADTRLFPEFLEETLGYFRDPSVAWVQTPHWFYDLPPGVPVGRALAHLGGRLGAAVGRLLPQALRAARLRGDPFGSDPGLFFDVIQRRRNRHGGSFCCGAGSIHRREALMEAALRSAAAARERRLQPFRFHVSEDIYTSILLHGSGGRWRSVHHPRVVSRMLSPWTMRAFALQRAKYARGSLDIAINDCPLFRPGMPWPVRLFYASTFYSYLASVFHAVLLAAPVIALATGISPVAAYSEEFFARLLPALVATELAILAGTWGHDNMAGRSMQAVLLFTNLAALRAALARRTTHFLPTPKSPVGERRRFGEWRFLAPHLAYLALAGLSALVAFWRLSGEPDPAGEAAAIINGFWLAVNCLAVGRILPAALLPPARLCLEAGDEPSNTATRQGDAHDLAGLAPRPA